MFLHISFHYAPYRSTSRQAVATDTLPHVYLHNRFVYDTYKDGSLEITGLENGECYDVTYNADKVVITFYKDEGKTQTGLQAVEGGHTRTVSIWIS